MILRSNIPIMFDNGIFQDIFIIRSDAMTIVSRTNVVTCTLIDEKKARLQLGYNESK